MEIVRVHCLIRCGDFPEIGCASHDLLLPWVVVNPYKDMCKHKSLSATITTLVTV